jgi:acetyl esterase
MTYQNGYWLTRDAMKWFWNNYLTNQTNVKDPTVSPLQASLEQLKALPLALILNGENDVLRGTIHDFLMLNPFTDDPAPRAAIEQASIMLKKTLSG